MALYIILLGHVGCVVYRGVWQFCFNAGWQICNKTTFQFAGLPAEMIEKGKDIKSISEIEQNGDHFKVTVTTGTKVMVNSFTIGQECELETLTGEKVKVSEDTTSPE